MSLQFWNHTKWIYHYFSTEISPLFPNKMNLRIIGCWYKKNQRLSRHQPCSLGGDLKIPLSCINAFIRMFIHSHIHSFAYVVVLTHTHTQCVQKVFPRVHDDLHWPLARPISAFNVTHGLALFWRVSRGAYTECAYLETQLSLRCCCLLLLFCHIV